MDTSIPALSVSQLAQRLAAVDAPLVLDVRRTKAFDDDTASIPGALRAAPDAIATWMPLLTKTRPIVVYCVHGHEVSQGAASALIAGGFDARFLEGGIGAWREAKRSVATKQPELGLPATVGSPSRWITRERPKIDRIACPWLVRRFVDANAQFLYVPSDQVLEAAKRENAVAYDVPGVRFTHRGEACSFDAFIADFGLTDPVLADLATIVRAADTGHLELSPQAPGLMAMSLGLSALYPNDHEMLAHGMTLYDALYAWLRSARGEVHNADLFKAR
jgi:rhodanese-related sulfurtransferase